MRGGGASSAARASPGRPAARSATARNSARIRPSLLKGAGRVKENARCTRVRGRPFTRLRAASGGDTASRRNPARFRNGSACAEMARPLLSRCSMRISLLPAALAALVAAGAAARAETADAGLVFAPVAGLERAEGASALALDETRGRLAVGDARGVWLREADGRVRRARGSGPVLDLAFTPEGALLAATPRGLYEIGLDARVTKRALGPGAAGRARRVLATPVGIFVASDDGILAATATTPFRPLDGARPTGEADALAWTPGAGAGRLWAIVAGDLFVASLETGAAGLAAQGFVREPLASQGS